MSHPAPHLWLICNVTLMTGANIINLESSVSDLTSGQSEPFLPNGCHLAKAICLACKRGQ